MKINAGLAYPWLEPSSAKSEAKYRVTADGQVRVEHVIDRRVRALLTTGKHPELVDMVAGVKKAHGDPPSGVFYINEWRHVLVKAGGGTWYAGAYPTILEFDLDGTVLSARAPAGLEPGSRWTGPQVGILYKIAASGDDIYCERKMSPHLVRREFLSDYVSNAADFVRDLSRFRRTGGRLYINEAREMFTPSDHSPGEFVYLGSAPIHSWFPEPRP